MYSDPLLRPQSCKFLGIHRRSDVITSPWPGSTPLRILPEVSSSSLSSPSHPPDFTEVAPNIQSRKMGSPLSRSVMKTGISWGFCLSTFHQKPGFGVWQGLGQRLVCEHTSLPCPFPPSQSIPRTSSPGSQPLGSLFPDPLREKQRWFKKRVSWAQSPREEAPTRSQSTDLIALQPPWRWGVGGASGRKVGTSCRFLS